MKKKTIAILICVIFAAAALCTVAFASAVNRQNLNAALDPEVLRLEASYSFGRTDARQDLLYTQEGEACTYLAKETLKAPQSAACLQCHGPTFKALAEKTKNYKDSWGDSVNPHTYVDITKSNPHASEVVPSCLECHSVHALPKPTAPVAKASLQYCYSCHHTQDFQTCSACHNE